MPTTAVSRSTIAYDDVPPGETYYMPIRCDVLRPSELGTGETDLWHDLIAGTTTLRRAFFTPEFALACERAGFRAYVAVLRDERGICGFFPFQFRSVWHEALRLAERVGGKLAQGSGVVARSDVKLSASELLRHCRLAGLHLVQLMEGQDRLGLDAGWSRKGYMTDIANGPDAYFADLAARNRAFVRDTERRLRRAERTYGPLQFDRFDQIPADAIDGLVRQKRQQYQRTEALDPFMQADYLRLIAVLNELVAPACRLVYTRLTAGDRLLAQHLGPQHHDVLSYWFQVHDPDARDLSPGRLLLWHTIRHAGEAGIKLIDRGEGDVPHKRDFATGSLRYGQAFWTSGGVRSFVARSWKSLEWRLYQRNLPKPDAERPSET